jgi:anti-anti-sigma factor
MTDLQQDWHCQNAGFSSAMKARLEIGERHHTGLMVLAPVGRIDNLTSGEFQKRLLAALSSCSTDVVIDFSGIDYTSSRGRHALMTASRRKPKEQRLAVAHLSTVVHEIFTTSRFTHLVPILATVEEARAAGEMPSPPKPAEQRDGFKPDPNAPLRVRFWGTRGSLPAPLREYAIRTKIRGRCSLPLLRIGRQRNHSTRCYHRIRSPIPIPPPTY